MTFKSDILSNRYWIAYFENSLTIEPFDRILKYEMNLSYMDDEVKLKFISLFREAVLKICPENVGKLDMYLLLR